MKCLLTSSPPAIGQGSPARAKGFTLVEILFVVTIVVIVLTAAGASIPGALASQRLSFAARQLSSDLNQAALLARKENRVVELRFYLMRSALSPGQPAAYRAYQAGQVSGWNAAGKPVTVFSSEVSLLPEDVVLMPDVNYNTLQKLEVLKSDDPTKASGADYVSYFIKADGSTTLPQDKPAVMTLVREKGGIIPTTLPTDFRSVVINPETHLSRVY